ncbi:MAG: nucleoside hydrolase, partial [Prochloraceae cyanobacterium]|nr:nucleoside hydrolase [Prochloraceae cyanobacterium]
TNLAELLETNEAIANKINRIYIMGGAVRVRGNIIVPGFTDDFKNEVAEWNIYVDAIAAQKVFISNVPITLIPLDATNYVPVTKDFTSKLKQNTTTEEAKFISQVFDKIQPVLDSGEYYFWDAVAAVTLVNKDFCNYENLKLDVIVDYTDDEDSLQDLPSFSQILENGKMRHQLDPYTNFGKYHYRWLFDQTTEIQQLKEVGFEGPRVQPTNFEHTLLNLLE